MKIIQDNITAITTTQEHPAFPRESLTTAYLKDIWKATSSTDTITVTASSGEAVVLFNTNATSIAIYKGAVAAPNLLTTAFDTELSIAWADYTLDAGSHDINIVLTTTETYLEVGKVVVGTETTFPDPRYGLKEGVDDTSIVIKLPSGGYYTKKRNMARTFEFSFEIERDTAFYDFMKSFYRENGPVPVVWRLNDSLTNLDWVIWAVMPQPPTASHDYFSHTIVSIKLSENL